MKNVAYKNAIIVIGGTSAAIITDKAFANKQRKVVTEETGFISLLTALNQTLDSIPNNDNITNEVFRIYVPDMLKGFAMGSYIEYIRTNQTSSGRAFSDKEKQLVTEIAHKMMNKGLNFKINETKFAPKEIASMKNYSMMVAKELKEIAPKQQAPAAQPQATVDPVAQIGLQIADAAARGDMATVTALTAALTALQAAKPATTPVVEEPQEEAVEEEEEYDENEVELPEDLLNAEY